MQNLKRWHWLIIAIAIGVVVGIIRNVLLDQSLNNYEESFSSWKEFEESLTRKIKTKQGDRFQMSNIKLTRDPNDWSGKTYIVTGDMVEHELRQRFGAPKEQERKIRPRVLRIVMDPEDKTENAPWHAVHDAYCRQAKVPDRKKTFADSFQGFCETLGLRKPDPAVGPAKAGAPCAWCKEIDRRRLDSTNKIWVDSAIKTAPHPPITFVDFFRRLSAQGVTFEYNWWREPRLNFAVCIALSLLAVGGVWPTLINLMVYGTLFRPKAEKTEGADLRHVKSRTEETKKPTGATVTDEDMEQLLKMEADLEAKLKASGHTITTGPAPVQSAHADAPVRKLGAGEAPVAATPDETEKADFERRAGDYYPIAHGKKKE